MPFPEGQHPEYLKGQVIVLNGSEIELGGLDQPESELWDWKEGGWKIFIDLGEFFLTLFAALNPCIMFPVAFCLDNRKHLI